MLTTSFEKDSHLEQDVEKLPNSSIALKDRALGWAPACRGTSEAGIHQMDHGEQHWRIT
jgi:hypothetical protein